MGQGNLCQKNIEGNSLFHAKKLRLRGVRELAQDHTVSRAESGLSLPRVVFFTTVLAFPKRNSCIDYCTLLSVFLEESLFTSIPGSVFNIANIDTKNPPSLDNSLVTILGHCVTAAQEAC